MTYSGGCAIDPGRGARVVFPPNAELHRLVIELTLTDASAYQDDPRQTVFATSPRSRAWYPTAGRSRCHAARRPHTARSWRAGPPATDASPPARSAQAQPAHHLSASAAIAQSFRAQTRVERMDHRSHQGYREIQAGSIATWHAVTIADLQVSQPVGRPKVCIRMESLITRTAVAARPARMRSRRDPVPRPAWPERPQRSSSGARSL